MCEAAAYLLIGDREELVLESIDILEAEEDQVRLVNMFGEEKKIRARIRSLSLINHRIILESL
jgi:predicted RNA-binding protein